MKLRSSLFGGFLDVTDSNRNGDTSADSGRQGVLLREARKLVEQRTGAERCGVPEQTLVRLVGEAMRDDGATPSHHGLAEFAGALAREEKTARTCAPPWRFARRRQPTDLRPRWGPAATE